MAITNNFITTGDTFEGFKIVKYLGPVFGMDDKAFVSMKKYQEACNLNMRCAAKFAEGLGANAIIDLRIESYQSMGNTSTFMFYGTAVIIEPIIK